MVSCLCRQYPVGHGHLRITSVLENGANWGASTLPDLPEYMRNRVPLDHRPNYTLGKPVHAIRIRIESPAAAGQIFYVSPAGNDANHGTQSAALWKTIGKFSRTLTAGDTAILMNGTYIEPEINFINSGTATMPITVRAQNKHQAILSSTSGCGANISVYGSYIIIEGLRSSIDPSKVLCASHNSYDGTGVRCWPAAISSTPSNPSSGRVGCIIRGVLFDASPARSHAVKISQDYTIVEQCIAYSGLEAFNGYGIIFRHNVIVGGDAWGHQPSRQGRCAQL